MESIDQKRDSPMFLDSNYCMPHTMNLILKPEKRMFKRTLFSVHDTSGNQLLKIVKGDFISMSKEWFLLDTNGSHVAILTHKRFSWHNVWRVYSEKNNDGFRVKRKDNLLLNVFRGLTDERDGMKDKVKKNGDFDIVGFPPRIYKGDTIVAEVNNKFSWGGDDLKKGFKVRVGAGTDYALILCLIMIHREMAISEGANDVNESIQKVATGFTLTLATSGG